MKIETVDIKKLILALGFKAQENQNGIHYKSYKRHDGYVVKIDFEKEKINYGSRINLGDQTTCNFDNSENFVVLECIDRLLEKGYPPERISLEHKWPVGRKEKGKLDILITDDHSKTYLMIECKTWGSEYLKEKKKMLQDGAQLFSYFQQDKSAQYLCLYSSRLSDGQFEYINDIVPVDPEWSNLSNQKEIFDHWNKNFKDNGIFDDWANVYEVEIKALTRGRLKELTHDDSGRIFNQFAEILRHNVVSDKPNAFNKIFNLFLCKIVDEDRKSEDELEFQWKEDDSDIKLQKRLSDLYKKGMREFLAKNVTDYNDRQVDEKLDSLDSDLKEQIKEMFTRIRLHKNNEFAFKEVYDEKSFCENAVVVKEVVELLQPFQIKYQHKQQFLGDFFELLLNTSIKQETGQFFTPVPIAKFIISSIPIQEIIEKKISNEEINFLPYIIDYAAGSGHFLTEAMDEVQKIIVQTDHQTQRPSVSAKINSWKANPFEWASDYVYGIEADYRLVKTAKVSCFLNGDGAANVVHADGLDNFKKSNDYKGKLKEVSHDEEKDNAQFDILVANPPYSVSSFKNTLKYGIESFELFEFLTDESSEIECLFIERMKQLLKPGGWAGIILPSSILTNSGIYTRAREIIFKYFDLKAIVEFGPNTFMATNVTTVTLFLERKENSYWKRIETGIKTFFNSPKESTISGIENAFSKYVTATFGTINLADYISLVMKNPNANILNSELFREYKVWFASLSEIKQLKEKNVFKEKSESEQQTELDKLFYDKVFICELERMLYYFLVYPQQTVLIKIGVNEAEEEFIGYKFSSRRRHEGIKMSFDDAGKAKTKLYDDQNHLNPEKVNSYIYKTFIGQDFSIAPSLSENIYRCKTYELMDFTKLPLEKTISLGIKKKIDAVQYWNSGSLVRLSTVADIKKGTSITKKDTKNGDIPVVAGGKEHAYYHNESNREGNIVTISASGAYSGYVNYWSKPIFASDCITVKSRDETVIKTKLIFHFLKVMQGNIYDLQRGQAQPHVYASDIDKLFIPLPSISIQKKIIKQIEKIETNANVNRDKIEKLSSVIEEQVIALYEKGYDFRKISDFAFINPSKSELKDIDESTIISFIEMASVSNSGKIETKVDKPLVELKGGSYKYFRENDLIIAKITPCMENGKCALARGLTNEIGMGSSEFHVIRVKDELNPKYLFTLLNRPRVREEAARMMTGASGHRRVPSSYYEDMLIPLPEKAEQEKFVSNIEKIENEIGSLYREINNVPDAIDIIVKQYLE
ncbi:MAG: N-6 DNA methylase [Bacteroidetes bacterium]|nr:N-6 DNA methylase [Bacteroidota bacterium]